jgi:dihydrofolate reductase
LPKLPNRTLVVATNNNISNVFKPDMIIIGGKQVYEYCLKNDLVHTAIVTEIDGEYDCDVFMDKGFLDGFTLDKQEQLSTCKISWYKKKDSY